MIGRRYPPFRCFGDCHVGNWNYVPGPQKPRNDAPAVALPEKSRYIYRVTMDDGYADFDQ
jgi:hypothetical protein